MEILDSQKRRDVDPTISELANGLPCGRLLLKIAHSPQELNAVFKLRFKVFNDELGEGLSENRSLGLDVDDFDRHCDHLMVIDSHIAHAEGIEAGTIGTYRILWGPRRPPRGYYTETEFDLSRLTLDPNLTVELGRGCIAPAYRKQTTLMALFWGCHRYFMLRQARYLIGCASLPIMSADDAMATYTELEKAGKVDPASPARPLVPNRFKGDASKGTSNIPPLLKLYLEFGARIIGEPAYDPSFKCYDLPVLLDHDEITEWGADLLSRFDKRLVST
jgi:putative hemolysin